MSGKISNLFTSLTSTNPKTQASASLYVEPSCIHQLFTLIKRHGNFRITSSPIGFEVHLGQRRFTITDSSEFIDLTLHHADALTEEAAETAAELAFILLPQTDNPLKLQASTIDDERRLWEGVKKLFPNHPIRAFNQDQVFRLDFLEKKHHEKNNIGTLESKVTKQPPSPAPQPGLKLGNLMGGFLKADEFGYKQSSIYIESDSVGFLIAFTKEHGELQINSSGEDFRILLKGHVISIENHLDLSVIRLLSPMSLGAAELMLRIIRFMYGHDDLGNTLDSLTNNLRENNSGNPLHQGNAETNANTSSTYLPGGPGSFGSLETPANVLNPNNSFHPRNLNNPFNPLNPRSILNPNNPLNPLSIYNSNNPANLIRQASIRISFETLHSKDEEVILKTLDKYASNSWKLDYKNPEQKTRVEQYFEKTLQNAKAPNNPSFFG